LREKKGEPQGRRKESHSLYSLIKGEKEIWEMEERPPHSHLFSSSPFYQRARRGD